MYVHGYNDYFFNRELAVKSDSAGYAFFAIDLHNYGRSLRKSEKAFQTREISEYFPELDSAMEIAQRLTIPLKDSTQKDIPEFLIGHSTGGLIVPLYAEERYKGKKIIGSAQFRKNGYILQHGSVLFGYNKEFLEKLFGEKIEGITTVNELLPDMTKEKFVSGLETWIKNLHLIIFLHDFPLKYNQFL